MQCHLCKSKTDVIETRLQIDGSLRRRRQCQNCNTRFTTDERLSGTSRPERESTSSPQPVKPKAIPKPAKVVSKKPTNERRRDGFELENVWNRGAAYEDLQDIGISRPRDDEW